MMERQRIERRELEAELREAVDAHDIAVRTLRDRDAAIAWCEAELEVMGEELEEARGQLRVVVEEYGQGGRGR